MSLDGYVVPMVVVAVFAAAPRVGAAVVAVVVV